jgi:putative two-component system response regulator
VGFLMNAYPIVYHHHERWDGKGYPDGIKGPKIPVGARIVAVVDAYDAMTTDRPYRASRDFAEVEAILRDGAGEQWDPQIVNVFIDTLKSYGNPRDDHEHGGIVIPSAEHQIERIS